MSTELPILTLADLVEILHRRLAWVIAVIILAVSAAGAASLLRTPSYEAAAAIALDQGDGPVDFSKERDPRSSTYSVLNTEREALLANAVLKQALDQGGLMTNPIYQDAVDPIAVLRDRLRVATNRDSLVITLRLRDEDPQRAQNALAAVVNVYLAQQSERLRQRDEEHITFLAQQVGEKEASAQTSRQAESAFRLERGLLGSDPERNLISQRLSELYTQEAELQRRKDASFQTIAAVTAAEALAEPVERRRALLGIEAIANQPLVGSQLRAVAEVHAEIAVLGQKYLQRHPRMVEANEQLLAREHQLDDAIATARDGLLLADRTVIAQIDGLRARVLEDEKRLAQFREDLITLAKLSEETQTHARMQALLTTRLEEQRISARLDRRRSVVLDAALASFTPVGPGRALILVLGLGMGLVLALTVPVIVDLLDRRLTTIDDARTASGLPVLAEIPALNAPFRLHPGVLGDDVGAEATRLLRSAITMHFAGDPSPRCIAIAPVDRHCELGVISARLAASLALAGARVLLVEADLRQTPLDAILLRSSDGGFADLLLGQPGVTPVASPIHNLDYLGPGAIPNGIGELLHSHCLPEWLDQCRHSYDFVVLNGSQLDAYADTLAMMPYLDLLVVVARTRSTTRRALARAVGMLNPFADRVLGLVLQGQAHSSVKMTVREEVADA